MQLPVAASHVPTVQPVTVQSELARVQLPSALHVEPGPTVLSQNASSVQVRKHWLPSHIMPEPQSPSLAHSTQRLPRHRRPPPQSASTSHSSIVTRQPEYPMALIAPIEAARTQPNILL